MTGFDFVLVLLSFVYALGLGHVLTAFGRQVMWRDRIRFSGLLALAMVNAVLQVYVNWISLWDFRSVERWDLPEITLFFVAAVITFLMCVVVSPEPEQGREGEPAFDLPRVYSRNYRWFYGFYLTLLLTFVAISVFYLETATPQLALQVAASNIPFVAVALLGLLVRRQWTQWSAGALMFGLTAYWLIMFAPALD